LCPFLSITYNRNKFDNSSKERINFLLYYKWNNFYKKNVDVEHIVIAKMFGGKINYLLKGSAKRQPTKKRMIVFGGSISKFFFSNIPLKERMWH
jgi:hypothetical protein